MQALCLIKIKIKQIWNDKTTHFILIKIKALLGEFRKETIIGDKKK